MFDGSLDTCSAKALSSEIIDFSSAQKKTRRSSTKKNPWVGCLLGFHCDRTVLHQHLLFKSQGFRFFCHFLRKKKCVKKRLETFAGVQHGILSNNKPTVLGMHLGSVISPVSPLKLNSKFTSEKGWLEESFLLRCAVTFQGWTCNLGCVRSVPTVKKKITQEVDPEKVKHLVLCHHMSPHLSPGTS